MRPILCFVVLTALAGCQRQDLSAEVSRPSSASPAPADVPMAAGHATTEPPTGHPPANDSAPLSEAPAPAATLQGKVLETIDAAGYTYLRIDTASGEVWAAVTKVPVKKGSEVTIVDAIVMEGFESKTLERKWDEIYFGSLGGDASATAPAGLASPHTGIASTPANVGNVKVPKADGADAKTIAEVHASRTSLDNAKVSVRGKVVKFLPGIMGKNWIHLRDGSGDTKKGDDDLTVTMTGIVAVGDVVVVHGVVHIDKDFGAGYSYQVIVEEATVSK